VNSVEVNNILVCGVGGQGIITIGRLIGSALVEKGINTRITEVHGLAQRGGSVNVHVRFGKDVHSPLISKGSANAIVALELIEALRYLDYLSTNGILIVNDVLIPPPLPGVRVPSREEVLEEFEKLNVKYYLLNALDIAYKAGHPAVANVVMIGAMIALKLLPLTLEDIEASIRQNLPAKFHEINIQALHLGFQATTKK